MQKIQLNKTTKRSNEKKTKQKTVLNIIATNKVKTRNGAWTNSKIIGMQCRQELFFRPGELRWDTVQSGRNVRLNYKTFFCKFSTCLLFKR